jgi:aminoglycoside phosphotransferase (APT) family kinase protein
MAAEIGVTGDAVPSLERERLEAFICEELPAADEVALSDISLASGGVSRDHFSFDLRWSQGGRRHDWPLILIRDGDRPGQTDRGAEFRLLRALEPTDVPAPRPYWCDTTGRWLDRPFIVMERVGGAVTPPFQIPYTESPALRQRLTERFVDVLCELHLLDWRGRGIDFLETPTCATEELAGVAARLFRAGVEKSALVDPHPTLERAMRWCIERAPRTRRWTLCHGDYKPDNVLHADGEILAVIDWERAHIGDPLADLAYVCAPHLRVGSLVSGLAALRGADRLRGRAARHPLLAGPPAAADLPVLRCALRRRRAEGPRPGTAGGAADEPPAEPGRPDAGLRPGVGRGRMRPPWRSSAQ